VGKLKAKIVLAIIALSIDLMLKAQISFSFQSEFSYLRGIEAALLPADWINPVFNDSGWQKGNAPFWYGEGANGVELTDMKNNYTTLYLRSAFECNRSDLIKELKLTADFDDGFIIWINGVEALRQNAPSDPDYSSVAPTYHEAGTGEVFYVNATPFNLTNGINIIAVQVFNNSLGSSDLYFDIELYAEPDLPELPDNTSASVSVPSGFFESPFDILITSSDPDALIVYTLDGSNPQNSSSGITLNSPASVRIDPESTAGRPGTPSVVVRASVYKPGYKASKPVSRTYIYIDKVKAQVWPGGNWPGTDINGQRIDLEMDSSVINSPDYSELIDDALLYIPTISIVTDLKNLFNPSSGIYVNAQGHGHNWEKECSVELINPDGSDGFMVNAGLRIRGGYSRDGSFPKHAFRLFFREEYGNDKLRYPLFGKEGTDEFDKIDLRCEQNYSWNNCCSTSSFVREVFSRDTQRDMGQPYTRSRYYHLYINGMYWGLYQTQERSDSRYASSYMGDDSGDYDVVKVNVEDWMYTIEATDGNLDSWEKLWNLCSSGFISNKNFYMVEGRDEHGKPAKGGEVLIDIDNLIDYMLVIFYTGNFDSPTSAFGKNKGANNFYAIDNRKDKSKGFTFFVHDAEHSLFNEVWNPGTGLYEDRVNIGTRSDDMRMVVSGFEDFHPQWLHYKLSANSEYRLRFADRAYRHFQPGGVFSTDSSLARLNKRIKEVDLAVIAESARWGDTQTGEGRAYTRNDNWLPEIAKIRNTYIPHRSQIVIDQLKLAGLYPELESPIITGPGGVFADVKVNFTSPMTITIENPNTSGTIYYTLDGNDPRATGGGVYSGSLFSLNSLSLQLNASAVIMTRVLSEGNWSALKEINFIRSQSGFNDLKVTELHYHPADFITGSDTINGKDLEFIEFKNTGKNAVNLSGLELDSAVSYQFPPDKLLAPGNFYVVVSKPSKFYEYYGLIPSGNFKGNFSNSGEEVLLKDFAGRKVIDFVYDDSDPWPQEADGDGYSLSSGEVNPSGDPSNYNYWTLSVKKDGTPFADNVLSDLPPGDSLTGGTLTVYPNPSTGQVTFRLETGNEDFQLEIWVFDQTGKAVIHTFAGNPDMIDLSACRLPEGLYFMKVRSKKYTGKAPVILLKKR
jgi:hypothetical protein